MGLSNVALTINAINNGNTNNEVVIDVKGGPLYNHMRPSNLSASSEYWMVIFDRRTLKVVENFMFTDNSNVPSQVATYLNDTNYFYVLSTQMMGTSNLPTGNLYKWLRTEGAGQELTRVEQAGHALNCSAWSSLAYVFVDVFGPKDSSSFEFSTLIDSRLIVTLELAPIDIGGTTFYSPVALG